MKAMMARPAKASHPPALARELDMLRAQTAEREAKVVEDARRRAQARAAQRKAEYERRQAREAARKELERAKKWVQRDRRLSSFLSRQAAKVREAPCHSRAPVAGCTSLQPCVPRFLCRCTVTVSFVLT